MIKGLSVLVLLMLLSPAVSAEIYQWEDSRGVVHFTDDDDKIPAKSRQKTKLVEPGSPGNQPLPAVQKPPVDPPARTVEQRYGGYPEAWWRSKFAVLREELQAAQDRLVAKKEEQTALRRKRAIYHRAKDRVAYNEATDQIVRAEEELKEIQARLSRLESEADQAEVPTAWRR